MTTAPGRTPAARLIAEQRTDQPDVVRLAQSLSLTAQAEPYVVREARLRFLPSSSTGLEAQLWFSPLVEAADSRALVLDPEVASALRWELAEGDRDFLASVRGFTERAHREAPLAVRTFESLLWSATAEQVPSEARVRRALAPFLAHVLAGGAEALEASRWALRYLPRLPSAVRDSAPARRLVIVAAERLGLDLGAEGDGEEAGPETEAVRRLVHGEVDIGVRATPEGVVLSRPPERDALVCQVSGAARVRLRMRAALPGASWHQVDLHEHSTVEARLDVVVAARFDGTVDGGRAELGDTVRSAWAGESGAVSVTAGDRTALRIDAGDRVLSAELPEPPGLLAVADDGPPRAAAAGDLGLQVVTAALDGSGEVAARGWVPSPAGLGWTTLSGPVRPRVALCVAQGRQVHLLEEGDPARVLLRLAHEADVVRLWSSMRAGLLAVADAEGRVVVHRPAPDGAMTTRQLCGPGPRVTALAGEPEGGALAWATEDGRVLRAGGGPVPGDEGAVPGSEGAPVVLGTLARPAVSLALSPAAGLVVAADGGRRVHRLPWHPAPQPGGSGEPLPAGAPLPFRVREVFAAEGDRLVLVGSGGPVEIRAEDGRGHLVLPDAAAAPVTTAGPAWLRSSIGAALPPSAAPSAELLRSARRFGVGHLYVAGDLLEDGPALAAAARRAGDAGVRLIADLAAAPTDSPGDLLVTARRLLDLPLDGLRLTAAHAWPPALVHDLRHLVDAYPHAALIAALAPAAAPAGSTEVPDRPPHLGGTSRGDAPAPTEVVDGAHLTVGGPAAELLRRAPGDRGWALPDAASYADTCRLLALPGCREVPYRLLVADDGHSAALRGLLAARSRQQALALGGATPALAEPVPGVAAVWRRHGSEAVLCLTNTSGTQRTLRVPARPEEGELVVLAEAVADGAPAPAPSPPAAAPTVLHAADGAFTVVLAPGRTLWLSAWDSDGTHRFPALAHTYGLPSD